MRRRILLAVLLSVLAAPASAATWVFVNVATGGSVNNSTLSVTGVDMTVGGNADTIFLACANYQARASCVPSDSSTNTYTPLTAREFAADTRVQWFYAKNATVTASMTFSIAAGSGGGTDHYPSLVVYGFRNGHLTAPFDAENGNQSGSSATTLTMGAAVTPAGNNELLLAVIGSSTSTTTPTINESYGTVTTTNFSASFHYTIGAAYWIQTTGTASNPTWTVSTSGDLAMGVAAFKPATGAGGPPGCKNGVLLSGAGCD